MATEKPATFDIATLNAISARLCDHADSITNAARTDVAADLRLAARVADSLANLRFRIDEIAEKAIEHPEWDRAAFARDLRDALAAAEAN